MGRQTSLTTTTTNSGPQALIGLVRTMRPRQWAKNAFVFAGLLFDQKLFELDPLLRVIAAFWLFSFMASAVYIINDLVDIERDRLHPKKRHRALPSGQLPPGLAIAAAIILPIVALAIAATLSVSLALVLLIYFVMQLLYSFYLKNIVIVDVFVVAAGFVLRTIAGVVIINVTNFSPWLYICVGLLALFLAVGKRRQELILLDDDATKVRDTYKGYNMPLLDDMLRMVVTGTAIAYALYATEAETALIEPEYMLLTVPLVYFALFRYLYVIHRLGMGGDPTDVLYEDRPLQMSIGLWGLLIIGLLYFVGQ